MNSADMFSTEDDDRYDPDEDDRHNSCCCLLRDKCLFNKNENSIFDNLNWCSNLSQNGCRYKLWGPCLEEGVNHDGICRFCNEQSSKAVVGSATVGVPKIGNSNRSSSSSSSISSIRSSNSNNSNIYNSRSSNSSSSSSNSRGISNNTTTA